MVVHYPHSGINRRDLDRILIELGGMIEHSRRTGEVLYRHPLAERPVRANGRRKDASRELTAFVRRIWEAIKRASKGQ